MTKKEFEKLKVGDKIDVILSCPIMDDVLTVTISNLADDQVYAEMDGFQIMEHYKDLTLIRCHGDEFEKK